MSKVKAPRAQVKVPPKAIECDYCHVPLGVFRFALRGVCAVCYAGGRR